MRTKDSGLVVAALLLVSAGGWLCACTTANDKSDADNLGGTGGMAAPSGTGGGATPGSSGSGGAAAMMAPSGSGGQSGSGGAVASGSAGSGGMPAMAPMLDAGLTDAGDAAVGEPPCEMKIPSSMDCGAPLAPGDERTCMLGS